MRVLSYTDARANFASVLDAVEDDQEEVIIHRAGHEPAVLISLAEYQSIKETDYLLRNPANAAWLRESIASLARGDAPLVVKSLEELELMAREEHPAA